METPTHTCVDCRHRFIPTVPEAGQPWRPYDCPACGSDETIGDVVPSLDEQIATAAARHEPVAA